MPLVFTVVVTIVALLGMRCTDELKPPLKLRLNPQLGNETVSVQQQSVVEKGNGTPGCVVAGANLVTERAIRLRLFTAATILAVACIVLFLLCGLVLLHQRPFPTPVTATIIGGTLIASIAVGIVVKEKDHVVAFPSSAHEAARAGLRSTPEEGSTSKPELAEPMLQVSSSILATTSKLHLISCIVGGLAVVTMASMLRPAHARKQATLAVVAQRVRMLQMVFYSLAFVFCAGVFLVTANHAWISLLFAETADLGPLMRAASFRSASNYMLVLASIHIPCSMLLTRVAYHTLPDNTDTSKSRAHLQAAGFAPSPLEAGTQAIAMLAPLATWIIQGLLT